ncbi:MAG: hypothetical protein IPM47_20770 [Sphingobacteriales bacterium]|nr:MAG: hypothetical protein IPM47_20770 [Sphingobacteriales bacterium]
MSDAAFYTLISMYVLFTIVVLAYYLMGPGKEKQFLLHQQFLKGNWQYKGVGSNREPWHINYLFSETDFEIHAQPPLPIKGKYKVVKELENLLLIEFYDIKSESFTYQHPQHLEVSIDRKDNQITIDGRTYSRIAPQLNQ